MGVVDFLGISRETGEVDAEVPAERVEGVKRADFFSFIRRIGNAMGNEKDFHLAMQLHTGCHPDLGGSGVTTNVEAHRDGRFLRVSPRLPCGQSSFRARSEEHTSEL